MTPIRSRVVGRVILERCVQRVEDTGQDREYDKVFADVSHHRRILGVPLMRGATPVGAITIGLDEPGPILDRHEDLLKTFADQAVIAIENVRLFNETKEALEQQTAISEVLRVISGSPTDVKPVLEAVAVRAAKICDASDARVILAEGHSLKHVAGFGDVPMPVEMGGTFPLDRGSVTGRAVIDCAPVHVTDMNAVPYDEYPLARTLQQRSGFRTILAVPLMRERRALGAVLLRRMEVRPFTEKQIALLKTFADQAAIAIENVRLFNETKEALEQQTATDEILQVISNSVADSQPVFERILQSCERLFGGNQLTIFLLGEDARLHVGAARGVRAEQAKTIFPVPLEGTATELVIRERRAVTYANVLEDPDVPPGLRQIARQVGQPYSIAMAPMLWEGRGIGSILVSRERLEAFTDKEMGLLRTFADQAVIAIQNARLFREIREKSAQLEIANKHKSEFLANMSHELRTPLNAVIGFSEALVEKMFGELNPKQEDYLKDIHSSGRHLLSLINDILDLSKIEAGRMELDVAEFDLRAALQNAITLVKERAQRHGVALRLEAAP